jgi:hypothetical protein
MNRSCQAAFSEKLENFYPPSSTEIHAPQGLTNQVSQPKHGRVYCAYYITPILMLLVIFAILICVAQHFEIIGEITNIETIAVGNSIRVIKRLRKSYGDGRWRKLKGITNIQLKDGKVYQAELHWYEMSSIGKKEIKIKRILL